MEVQARGVLAEPFLTQAKGPAAPLFYAMVHDIDGRQRLKIEKDPKTGKLFSKFYLDAWTDLDNRVDAKYRLSDEQTKTLAGLNDTYAAALDNYLKENLDEIRAYFGSLDRFEAAERAGNNGAEHQVKRRGTAAWSCAAKSAAGSPSWTRWGTAIGRRSGRC